MASAFPREHGTQERAEGCGSLETRFDATFAARVALREKQIQQNFRPVIGVHKWFARRPGSLFRCLLLAEFGSGDEPAEATYFRAHRLGGTIADPFMGGGTPVVEANRLGFHVIGSDINPMAWWIVRQELGSLDDDTFAREARAVAVDVEAQIGRLYRTECESCGADAEAKYFVWVKTQACPSCGTQNDLTPGHLLAEATRHPRHVLSCSDCTRLVELDHQPTADNPAECPHCGGRVQKEGRARKGRADCRQCGQDIRYPEASDGGSAPGVPEHRMWAIEYHCERCKHRPDHKGRFFKSPDDEDLRRVRDAVRLLGELEDAGDLPIPDAEIPSGDETKRLHRWGYRRYRDMFNARQLLGLGLLLRRIRRVNDERVRHALLTVFSDILRYQNMLCRYDTYALKCQDIFAVHGFPVGLNQCEANLLGIPGVGAGGFRHFVEKYRRAKAWCREPFEKRREGNKNVPVPISGESVEAQPVSEMPAGTRRQAFLSRSPAAEVPVRPGSLDGVFTDPPYFDNVQYAELMDFCYVWLRQGLADDFHEFRPATTQSGRDLTGNRTLGRGLEHFTQGLSEIFSHYGRALKPAAPFVFTYHHNKIEAYAPLVVAMLDAQLACTAVLPAPGEMEASLHIHGTGSSVLDSVFVLRAAGQGFEDTPVTRELPDARTLESLLAENLAAVAAGGVKVTLGDARCLFSGHVARLCSVSLRRTGWDAEAPLDDRLARVREELDVLAVRYGAPENDGGTPARAVARSKALDRRDQMTLFAGEADGDS